MNNFNPFLGVHLIGLCIIFHFLLFVYYILPSAASIPLTCYYKCLIIHKKVPLNRFINPNLSLPHWFERNGVFERKGLQSSRCLAYLNGRPLHPHPPAYHPRDSVWIVAGSFVSAFILALTKCGRLKERRQGYQRVRGDPPPPNDTTLGGELVTDPPIHGFILLQQAGKELSPLL